MREMMSPPAAAREPALFGDADGEEGPEQGRQTREEQREARVSWGCAAFCHWARVGLERDGRGHRFWRRDGRCSGAHCAAHRSPLVSRGGRAAGAARRLPSTPNPFPVTRAGCSCCAAARNWVAAAGGRRRRRGAAPSRDGRASTVWPAAGGGSARRTPAGRLGRGVPPRGWGGGCVPSACVQGGCWEPRAGRARMLPCQRAMSRHATPAVHPPAETLAAVVWGGRRGRRDGARTPASTAVGGDAAAALWRAARSGHHSAAVPSGSPARQHLHVAGFAPHDGRVLLPAAGRPRHVPPPRARGVPGGGGPFALRPRAAPAPWRPAQDRRAMHVSRGGPRRAPPPHRAGSAGLDGNWHAAASARPGRLCRRHITRNPKHASTQCDGVAVRDR